MPKFFFRVCVHEPKTGKSRIRRLYGEEGRKAEEDFYRRTCGAKSLTIAGQAPFPTRRAEASPPSDPAGDPPEEGSA